MVPDKTHWTVRSGVDVATDIRRYFRGEDLDAYAWFRDGHFRFCGRGERATVSEALFDVAGQAVVAHEDELFSMVGFLATRRFTVDLSERIKGVRDPVARRRLERMKAEAESALGRRTKA